MGHRDRIIEGFKKPILCYFCGKEVIKLKGTEFDCLVLHSLDGDHDNWDPVNKEVAHNGCHMTYHNTKRWARTNDARVSGEEVKTYIVEYDLPTDSRRRRFYRRIQRYLRLHYLDEVGWSTGSVVVTESRDFAWYVWREARGVGGTAHIYEGHQLDVKP